MVRQATSLRRRVTQGTLLALLHLPVLLVHLHLLASLTRVPEKFPPLADAEHSGESSYQFDDGTDLNVKNEYSILFA